MTTTVAGRDIEIAGSLKRLPLLPNVEHQHLFNAENCTVSAEGSSGPGVSVVREGGYDCNG